MSRFWLKHEFIHRLLPIDSKDKMTIRYALIIYWSEIDRAFIVEVPELPGCAEGGETYQDAVQNVEVVIKEWIETAQTFGRPIPEPKSRLLFA